MYVPRLVREILDGPDAVLRDQLSGVLLGNPHFWCDSLPKEKDEAHWVFVQNWFYHGLVPYSMIMQWEEFGCNNNSGSATDICDSLYDEIRDAADIGGANQKEDLHEDTCNGNSSMSSGLENSGNHSLCDSEHDRGPIFGYKAYLNTPELQQSVHAEGPRKWGRFSDDRWHYSRDDTSLNVDWRVIFAQAPNLKVLIYSGDEDIATNPPQVTQACFYELRDIRGNQTKTWGNWWVSEWHAGFVESFDRYTYATVKGAGHRVPEYAPLAAGRMYERFIANGNLDDPDTPHTDRRRRTRRRSVASNLFI